MVHVRRIKRTFLGGLAHFKNCDHDVGTLSQFGNSNHTQAYVLKHEWVNECQAKRNNTAFLLFHKFYRKIKFVLFDKK